MKKKKMTKYEGTIILRETGRENTVEELQNLITGEIDSSGGKAGEFNADGLKEFSRVANRKNPNGYYIEVGFESDPSKTGELKKSLLKIKDIFRVFITKQD